jgi:hypothetical protein
MEVVLYDLKVLEVRLQFEEVVLLLMRKDDNEGVVYADGEGVDRLLWTRNYTVLDELEGEVYRSYYE